MWKEHILTKSRRKKHKQLKQTCCVKYLWKGQLERQRCAQRLEHRDHKSPDAFPARNENPCSLLHIRALVTDPVKMASFAQLRGSQVTAYRVVLLYSPFKNNSRPPSTIDCCVISWHQSTYAATRRGVNTSAPDRHWERQSIFNEQRYNCRTTRRSRARVPG